MQISCSNPTSSTGHPTPAKTMIFVRVAAGTSGSDNRSAATEEPAAATVDTRGVIDRQQRQRLEFLLDRELCLGLDGDEVKELAYLKFLNGTGPAAPAVPIKDGGTTSTGPAVTGRSGRQALLDTLAMKYPRRPIRGKDAVLQTLAMRWPNYHRVGVT